MSGGEVLYEFNGGELHCVHPECPKPTCDEPRIIKGQCCQTCDEFGPDSPVREGPKPSGCDLEWGHYDHLDVFPSNRTALKPKPGQCVLCLCYDSKLICHLKTCQPTLKCPNLVEMDDDCCMHCDVTDAGTPGNSAKTKQSSGDCVSSTSEVHANGSTWNPVIFSFGEVKLKGGGGEVKCVQCRCLNGIIDCYRLQCPEESTLKCDNPQPDPDGCCKECPTEKHRQVKDGKIRKGANKKKPTKGSSKPIFSTSMSLNDVIGKLCLPKGAERVVYYTKGDNFLTLAFDDPKKNLIEQMHWVIKRGRVQSSVNKKVTDTVGYRKKTTVADILGVIDKKNLKRFLRRLEKRQGSCPKKCRRKLVENAIKKMPVKTLDLKKKKCAA
ncbi:chordin-like protein 2 [Physella acuta]|uniref:chordin-like protein 2 n=1 Tax=Physella acuta TaxID=109671 RepID=UPI0027DE560E|nr:chordin-like protein 2 [Physella acuta]